MVNLEDLREAIDNSGLRQQFIADRLGITRQTLINKLNGKSEFKASEMHEMRMLLRMPVKEFRRIFFAADVN